MKAGSARWEALATTEPALYCCRSIMISQYTEHAANERTYLAWVRTAIAVMAFGFLVEKFDLFLQFTARAVASSPPSTLNALVGDVAGLLLILLGATMLVAATIRFRQTGRDIDDARTIPARGVRLDEFLVGSLLVLAGTLFAYLVFTVLRHF